MKRFAFTPVTAKLRQPRPSRIWSALPWCAAFASACIYNDWDLKSEPSPTQAVGSAGAAAGGDSGIVEGGAAGEQTSGGETTADDAAIGGAGGAASGGNPSTGAAGDSGAAGAIGRGDCDLEQDFGEPFLVPFSEPGDRTDGRLTADEKTIYFHANEGIWKATWSEVNARFENETVVLDEPNSDEMTPSITDDGLELYYVVPGEDRTNPNIGIHISRRKRIEDRFLPGELVRNLPENNGAPFIASNGNTLYFIIDWQVWAVTKTDGVFGNAQRVLIHGTEEPDSVMLPTLSADEKTILVGSYHEVEGGQHSWSVIRATRQNLGGPFSGAAVIPSLVKANTENQPHWISRDGCRLYFHRHEDEHTTLWMASRPARE